MRLPRWVLMNDQHNMDAAAIPNWLMEEQVARSCSGCSPFHVPCQGLCWLRPTLLLHQIVKKGFQSFFVYFNMPFGMVFWTQPYYI